MRTPTRSPFFLSLLRREPRSSFFLVYGEWEREREREREREWGRETCFPVVKTELARQILKKTKKIEVGDFSYIHYTMQRDTTKLFFFFFAGKINRSRAVGGD